MTRSDGSGRRVCVRITAERRGIASSITRPYNPASRVSASPKRSQLHAHAVHEREVQAAELAVLVAACSV